ncbi:hypothetical protein Q0F99_04530 [Rathayibacter oskolensis]|nr:hypothetical protein [Rathayibacter oskolensis]WKK72264.1 hypothetical protein Q0F99_04530 [Rathayibacter oskolensis]
MSSPEVPLSTSSPVSANFATFGLSRMTRFGVVFDEAACSSLVVRSGSEVRSRVTPVDASQLERSVP